MLSFVLRRARLRLPGTFRVVQRLPTHAVLSNQLLALASQRNFTTTTNNRNKESTPNVEPEPEPKPKSKKTTETERKVTIKPQDRPPKNPSNPYGLWYSEWSRSQPKVENRLDAQSRMKEGAQVWNALSDHEKQQYREKSIGLWAEHKKRLEEWHGQVDPAVLKELNRRRVAKGQTRILARSDRRPVSGYIRYSLDVRREYPGTEAKDQAQFGAVSAWVANQWKAMSDTEKAKYTDQAKADLAAWHEKRKAESQAKPSG